MVKRRAARAEARGVTLVELLITLSLLAIVVGVTSSGLGAADGARLRRSAGMIAAAIRVAYGHSTAIGRPVRLVFDLEGKLVALEEGTAELRLAKKDKTGGAAAVTEAEKKSVEEAEAIVKGPRAPRPTFQRTKAFGFDGDAERSGKPLDRNIRFVGVEVQHDEEVARSGRAYLYFWPGGQTERAAIELGIAGSDDETDVLTILVSPLTGKAEIKRGRVPLQRPRDETEESERRDTGM